MQLLSVYVTSIYEHGGCRVMEVDWEVLVLAALKLVTTITAHLPQLDGRLGPKRCLESKS